MPKFEEGNPGGPGRPRGSRTLRRFIFDKIGEEAAETVVNKVVEAARNGDLRAAELLFRHMCPRRKGQPVEFDLPPMRVAEDIVPVHAALLEAIGAGELTPDEGTAVSGVLEQQRRSIELAEIARRLEALETEFGVKR